MYKVTIVLELQIIYRINTWHLDWVASFSFCICDMCAWAPMHAMLPKSSVFYFIFPISKVIIHVALHIQCRQSHWSFNLSSPFPLPEVIIHSNKIMCVIDIFK